MNGWCVCCEEFARVDPEDGHCWSCSTGQCRGEHDDEEDCAADDPDDGWEEARGEYFDERWLDEREL